MRDALRLLILRDYAWWMLRPPTLPEPIQRLYAEGLNALADGSYLKANRLLEQTVQQPPGFVPATLRLAETYLELDQIQKAQETLLWVNGARSRCPSREGEYCSRRSTSARTAGFPGSAPRSGPRGRPPAGPALRRRRSGGCHRRRRG